MFRGLIKVTASVPRAVRTFAAEATNVGAAAQLQLNFTTPHAPIHVKKSVNQVILPGVAGEYGVTVGHSPIISELRPGVVSVIHLGGEVEKYFVPGGFALTHPNSVTDVSVPEAFPLNEFDESAIKSAHAEATRNFASAAEGSIARSTAQIEIDTYTSLARSLGIVL